jgi:two-component system phosphate regulon response regulator PhoB
MSNQILIVEDERDLVGVLEYNLQREGYRTRAAVTGTQALQLLEADPLPDLVLLDLMLPDMSGTEICRELRRQERTRNVAVLMLTAKGEEIDRVVGFEVGADDYVVKPFSLRELLLRVKALLRRAQSPEPETLAPTTFGLIRIDPASHRVWVDEGEVKLTALEFKLLREGPDARAAPQ